VRLAPVSVALALTLLLSGAGAGLLLYGALSWAGPSRPSLGETLEIVKICLAVVAGVGGVIALVVAYRRQRVAEAGEGRERS
jgi:hypothetical protein